MLFAHPISHLLRNCVIHVNKVLSAIGGKTKNETSDVFR